MMKKSFLIAVALLAVQMTKAQERNADTVKVPLAKASQIIFTVGDRNDLEVLKHYDFKALFQDIISKLESGDTIKQQSQPSVADAKSNKTETCDSAMSKWKRGWNHSRSWQSFNFDLGTNNYLSRGKFPENGIEDYSVRPWGSWYVGMSSIQRAKLGKKFFLELGLGVSWYNFKFEDDKVSFQRSNFDNNYDLGVDPRSADPAYNFKKSKLTATYINASIIPVFDVGGSRKKSHVWDKNDRNNAFRIGLGPYVGYRIASHSKLVYTANGDEKKDHIKDSFGLNNLRYGVRLQLGFRSTDLFFNYDLNKLFASDRGPDLNAISFGVIF